MDRLFKPFTYLMGCVLLALSSVAWSETGVTGSTIRVGGVMDLQGDSRGLGQGMKAGLEAAFRNRKIQGRQIELLAINDNYSPAKTVEATRRLIGEGIFAMVGNVGTPTAKVALPILAENNVPAVGFFTGAGLLRPGVGDIVNFRASYVQETAAVIDSAIQSGLEPDNICAFVQNDSYGMAGVEGIKRAISNSSGTLEIRNKLDTLMAMSGENPPRNNVGPVGVYQRNTLHARAGYESLKRWERSSESRCRLVVTVGTYQAIARFAAYSRGRGESWMISAVSFTGADNFRTELESFQVNDRVIMTQVVPPLDSDLPMVRDARKALGDAFGYVSLEGYIVGRMFVEALGRIKGPITRDRFLAAIRGQSFEIGGLQLDFNSDNQGSDFVSLTYMERNGYRPLGGTDWSLVASR